MIDKDKQVFKSDSSTGIKQRSTFDNSLLSGKLPEFNINDNDNEVVIDAELPGVDANDINLTYQNGLLTINANKKGGHQESYDNYYYNESWSGSFSRSISLSPDVDIDKAMVECKDGNLNIHIPKFTK